MHDIKERSNGKLAGIVTRKPTGKVPYPLILLEGSEKSGKSWSCAELSASELVGDTYWIDLGEGAADEYGAVPGARYQVVEHDGTWTQIVAAVEAVRDEAKRAADQGEKPTVLVIDSMTNEWELLKSWAASRAAKSAKNQDKLRRDPHADVDITMNLWNDANTRHRRLMTLLMTFPGIVVITARGKEVAGLDDNGRPNGSTEYKVEGQKTLTFDATSWVRMSRENGPQIIGIRSVYANMRPGIDKPRSVPDFTLEKLVFEVMRCDTNDTHTRKLSPLDGDEKITADSYRDKALQKNVTVEDLRTYWMEASANGLIDTMITSETGDEETLKDFFTRRRSELSDA